MPLPQKNNLDESYCAELASGPSASAMVAARMPSLQFCVIRTSRAGVAGSIVWTVPVAGHTLRQLLAPLLLVRQEKYV